MKTESHHASHTPHAHSDDSVSSEVANLKDGFTQLRADVVSLFSHAFGLGKNGVGAVEGAAVDAMEHLKERVAGLKERGASTLAAAEKKIEKNPVSSAMIAFGVGYIIARILHRRH